VITEVLEQEMLKYSNSGFAVPTSLSSIMAECVLILASAPKIFTAAVDGSLLPQYLVDSNLQAEYTEVQERAHIQPSIYIHLLADASGNAPTPNQYMVIRDIVLQYIDPVNSDSELAYQIDCHSFPELTLRSSRQGFRKYLATPANPRSPQREEAIQRFCDGILQRWQETPESERNLPLTFPPGECGYALNSHKRLGQHRNRQSSNYIMNLVEDVCTCLPKLSLPLVVQHFHLHQFIIYLIFRPSQAEIAEIFCSGLLQVWVDNGGGFNHYPAGRSNASARRVAGEKWRDFENHVRTSTKIIQNVSGQRERVEEGVDSLNEDAARLWREVLDSLSDYDGGRILAARL
jgi:hypothetical protein